MLGLVRLRNGKDPGAMVLHFGSSTRSPAMKPADPAKQSETESDRVKQSLTESI